MAVAIAWPTLAQEPPPVHHNVDPNGVDVVLGTFEVPMTFLSIGPDWPHGLQYRRGTGSLLSGGIHQEGNVFYVSVGNTSAKFTYSGGFNLFNPGTFSSDLGDGSTLTRSGGAFTYTDANGRVVRYTAAINTQGRIVLGTDRMLDLRYPSGALVTLNHRNENLCDEQGQNCTTYSRIQSVTNNFNYQLHYTYARNTLATVEELEEWRRLVSVTAINTGIEPCDPIADSCTLSQPWPSVAFAINASFQEEVTLPDNNVWRFGYGTCGTTSIRRPGSSSDDVTVTCDAMSRVQSLTGAAGTWTYSYSANGTELTTTAQGPLGGGRVVVSDSVQQLVTSVQDALGRTTGFQYDSNGRLTRVTEPEGNYVSFSYDARGNVEEMRAVAKPGTGGADLVLTADYPDTCANPVTCNQPTLVRDANGNQTDFTYDSAHGGVLTITSPAPTAGAVRPQVRATYTATNVGGQTVRFLSGTSQCQTQASCAGTADEAVTSLTYSGANFLPTTVTSGNGNGTLTARIDIAYDNVGNALTFDGPLAGAADTTRLRYDPLRQIVGVIGPDPDGGGTLRHRAQRITYDASGLEIRSDAGTVESQSDADWAAFATLESVETTRDARGRPTHERLTSGGTTYALTQSSYDAAGRVECVTERMNPSGFASPPAACSLDTLGSYGRDRIARLSYDANGRVTLVESGVLTSDEADEAATAYTANGQVSHLTDGEGNRTTYEYDGHDRRIRTRFPNLPRGSGTSSATDYEELTLDANGNATNVRLRDNTQIALTYDALNRVTFKNLPGSELDVTYAYDLLGRTTSATTSAQALAFTFDALGRNITQTGPRGTASYEYDSAGRRTKLTYPGTGLFVNYDYLVTGEVAAIRENGATSGIGVLATYAYDDRGRRTSLTRGNGTSTTYSYDPVSRLASLVHELPGTANDLTLGFGYNPAGQIVSNTRSNDLYAYPGLANENVSDTHNGLNQILVNGWMSVGHDARGNISTVNTSTFGYDSENRLTSALGSVALSWDPLGRLYETVGGGATARFAYDGGTIIGEYNSSNGIRRRIVHGPGIDEPLVSYEGSGTATRLWYHADDRGSVVALSDNAGAAAAIQRYDEYGRPEAAPAARFGYTGQPWIGGTGLWHYRARMYNPALGRFMQTDPTGYGGGMNLYAYVLNDPVNLTDPFGLQAQDDGDEQEIFVTALRMLISGGIGGGTRGGVRAQLLPGPLPTGPCIGACDEYAIVTGRRRRQSLRGVVIGSAVAALGQLAEWLEPPEGRQPGETFDECVIRVADIEEMLRTAESMTLLGMRIVPYPGTTIGGRRFGTSPISLISRAAFGNRRMGSRVAGTRSFGGAIGRVTSRASVAGGIFLGSFAAGKIAGAIQACR